MSEIQIRSAFKSIYNFKEALRNWLYAPTNPKVVVYSFAPVLRQQASRVDVIVHTGLRAVDITELSDYDDPFNSFVVEPPEVPKTKGRKRTKREGPVSRATMLTNRIKASGGKCYVMLPKPRSIPHQLQSMCGIYASVSKTGPIHPNHELKQLLSQRGPDQLGQADAEIRYGSETTSISFTSTVLALRGGQIAMQPLIAPLTGSILCWNGEAWKIGHEPVEGNDGEAVLELLTSHASSLSVFDSITSVLKVIQSISGPFAFVYFDKMHDLLYFGRDYLGRRSLLFDVENENTALQFSSIAGTTGGSWREVEADGIYVLAISSIPIHPSLSSIPPECAQSSCFSIFRTLGSLESPRLVLNSLSRVNVALPLKSCHLDSHSSSVKQLQFQLQESLKLRVLNIPTSPNPQSSDDTKLAILFSGGLDCTVLARMAHDLMPADEHIDLVNVAFENPRVQAARFRSNVKSTSAHPAKIEKGFNTAEGASEAARKNGDKNIEVTEVDSAYESCPDRITGRRALEELRKICPRRLWRFVEVNIPYTETMSHKDKIIALMYPHSTEMDLSIAYALYFAARGTGLASTDKDSEPTNYTTPARVLLSGLGADELFGGYTRHAIAFERRGFPGLLCELELDINRLGKRNLGRDDRVISNWGREARYPYLDESLVKWALESPAWGKCGFGTETRTGQEVEEALEPGKKVLRLLAMQLGLLSAAKEKKRAIQFGARTAKMVTGRTKGTSHIS